jgi:Na+/melibiose symporter-like transporter
VAEGNLAEGAEARGRWTVISVLPRGTEVPVAACYLSYFGLAFFALRWWKMADRRRPQRFSLYSVFAAGFIAYLLLFLWPRPSAPVGVVSLIMASVIIQLVSPWEQQPPPPRNKRLRLRYA